MSLLFTPSKVRGVDFPNRVCVSPMCMYSAGLDGIATAWHLVHLGSRATGGAGLVFVEATAVVPEGRITDGDLGLWNDEQRDALRPIAAFLRQVGAVPGIQLAHAGRKGGRRVPWTGYDPIPESEWGALPAPSPLPFKDGWAVPHEMSVDDIHQAVRAFAEAARRAAEAGFDVIELHYAHGYLIHQFLSPLTNRRTDDYGGSASGRARLAVEIATAVRAEIGNDLVLFARLSVVDWIAGGLTEEDSVEISRLLGEVGVDVIDCSSGALVAGETVPAGPLYQVGFASRIRRESGVHTAAVGMITTAAEAEAALSDEVDFVLIGRAFLRDAYWTRRAAIEIDATDVRPHIPMPYRRAVERMSKPSQW